MSGRPDRLIYMANQIAKFFAAQPEGAQGAAGHLRSFWDPRMRRELAAIADDHRADLRPLVLDVIPELHVETRSTT